MTEDEQIKQCVRVVELVWKWQRGLLTRSAFIHVSGLTTLQCDILFGQITAITAPSTVNYIVGKLLM